MTDMKITSKPLSFDKHVQFKTSLNDQHIKGIVGDSNNIFLWYESGDIDYFKKFQLIPILHWYLLQMHEYVHWHSSIHVDYSVWTNSHQQEFMWKLLLFHTEMIC